MMVKRTVEELTCPEAECGFVGKNANGLRGHMQFKHGVPHSGAQLPLEKQDLLISESKLEQVLDERFGTISEQLDVLSGAVAERDGELGQLVVLTAAITALQERVDAQDRRTIADFPLIDQARHLTDALTSLDEEAVAVLVAKVGKGHLLSTACRQELHELGITMQDLDLTDVIVGSTDLPGYKYLDCLGLSIKEKP